MERKTGTLTWMHRSVSLHVRKREVRFTVTAVGGAKQREERGGLRNGHQLAVTERPSFGCKIKWENADLSNKRVCHKILCLRWEDTKERDDEVNAEIGLEIVVRLAASGRRDRGGIE